MENIVGPMSFDHASIYLSKLIKESQAFIGGSKPVIGRLKTSYGYKKVIGILSFDHKVRTRIDYDPFKGYHFNFENDQTGEKICILINDMTKEQYEKYIDTITKGRGPIETPKMANLSYRLILGRTPRFEVEEEYGVIDKVSKVLGRDKFVMDYYDRLLSLGKNYEIDLSVDEIKSINRKRNTLNNKIIKNVLFMEYYCNQIGIDLDIGELYDTYLTEDSFNENYKQFRK